MSPELNGGDIFLYGWDSTNLTGTFATSKILLREKLTNGTLVSPAPVLTATLIRRGQLTIIMVEWSYHSKFGCMESGRLIIACLQGITVFHDHQTTKATKPIWWMTHRNQISSSAIGKYLVYYQFIWHQGMGKEWHPYKTMECNHLSRQ